ncbi:glycine/D-amino acid oxidase-like deaminating enzyme [Paenibacillus cellulosilyticus]|uniref:Glycine/D-amino acid oxidase-like deaminating enzyme n=1 Tax=Paenibacillus cellulosilyticus TaxID=375489 RepID=A0A2V2YXY3_9BACL|nr:FAD-dependent oxidoreductase [Paenibacillus cellulosilyticus]PWW03193.1 glycine/D-amino acid oxidase-like deaminating enzyme [Paenibacillus cellulosilyticus]QKS43683.1 FAD-dependent oxidoreductase [Paenibacillus cellulosilyticus]
MTSMDIIIVGGGVIGQAIAYSFSEDGLRVGLVDDQCSGNGKASTAAGGMLGAFGEVSYDRDTEMDEVELEYRIHAAKKYPNWLKDIEEAADRSIFHSQGTLIVANRAGVNDLASIKKIAVALERHNEKYEWVDPEQLADYKPDKDYIAYKALLIGNEGAVDTTDLMESLIQANRNRGIVSIVGKTESLIVSSGKIEGIMLSDERKLFAPRVILCAGVGTQNIIEHTDKMRLPEVMAIKGSSLLVSTTKPIQYTLRTPNRESCGLHLVPRNNGQIYIGATHRNILSKSSVRHTENITLDEINYLIQGATQQLSSELRGSVILNSYYGYRPATLDRFPIVGETEVEGLLVATGTYRNGILMAPIIAEVIRATINGAEHPLKLLFTPYSRNMQIESLGRNYWLDNGMQHLLKFIKHQTNVSPTYSENDVNLFTTSLLKILASNNERYVNFRDEINKVLAGNVDLASLRRLYNRIVLFEKRNKNS